MPFFCLHAINYANAAINDLNSLLPAPFFSVLDISIQVRAVLIQIICVILDIAITFDGGIERSNYESAPCTQVNGTNLWHMIGIKHKVCVSIKLTGDLNLFSP